MSSGGSLSGARRCIRARIVMWCAPRRSCTRPRGCRKRRSPSGLISRARRCRSGENASARGACKVRGETAARSAAAFFSAQVAEVKALARELPPEKGVPLSRWSGAELAREAVKRGIVVGNRGMTGGMHRARVLVVRTPEPRRISGCGWRRAQVARLLRPRRADRTRRWSSASSRPAAGRSARAA